MKFWDMAETAERACEDTFKRIDAIELQNTQRVLEIFQRHQVAARHFNPTTGYGYGDVGRDTLEAVYADVFGTEAAIVRPQITSGTHALSLCMFGLLLPGDELLSVTGKPYDTLDGVIGISEKNAGSLHEMGVRYAQMEMTDQGLDLQAIEEALTPQTKVVYVQRSRGYALRPTLMPGDFAPLKELLKKKEVRSVFGRGQLLRRVYADGGTYALRRGRLRRQSDQESRRRTGADGRLYCRIKAGG